MVVLFKQTFILDMQLDMQAPFHWAFFLPLVVRTAWDNDGWWILYNHTCLLSPISQAICFSSLSSIKTTPIWALTGVGRWIEGKQVNSSSFLWQDKFMVLLITSLFHLPWHAGQFLPNRVIYEEGTPIEETFSPELLVSMSVCHLREWWLTWEGSAHFGQWCPGEAGSGTYRKGSWTGV